MWNSSRRSRFPGTVRISGCKEEINGRDLALRVMKTMITTTVSWKGIEMRTKGVKRRGSLKNLLLGVATQKSGFAGGKKRVRERREIRNALGIGRIV